MNKTKTAKGTSMRDWLVMVALFALFAIVLPMIHNDMQDSVRPLGRETTYHFGPAVFVNVDVTVGREDGMELVEITRYLRAKSYLLKEVKGRLLIKSVELSGDGQAASYWDDYSNLPSFDRALIDQARAKVAKKRAKNAEA